LTIVIQAVSNIS